MWGMVLVRQVDPEDWRVLRDIRLAALRDAPDAFGSTYEQEAAFAEQDWRRRAAGRSTFFGYLPEVSATDPAGLAGGYLEQPDVVELVSMWVSPRARGHRVGEALVTAVADWAKHTEAATLHLWVTEANQSARRLYGRCGFTPTGERQPLPSSPDLDEIGMARSL
jgi:GNAT superfamily N-acetyltransferase